VSSSGQVKISGTTNHPMLASGEYENYTSKNNALWILNITINDTFSDYIYSVQLPLYSSVNYIKASSPFRIEENSQRITIIGTGNSEPMYIIIQYKINPRKNSYTLIIFFLALAVSGIAIYLFASKKQKQALKIGESEKESAGKNYKPHNNYNEEALTERQKKIVRLIEKKGGASTQNVLEKELSIPKASLSRNLVTLSKKGIIKKESKGMSNIIYCPHKDEKGKEEENNSDAGKKKIKYWN